MQSSELFSEGQCLQSVILKKIKIKSAFKGEVRCQMLRIHTWALVWFVLMCLLWAANTPDLYRDRWWDPCPNTQGNKKADRLSLWGALWTHWVENVQSHTETFNTCLIIHFNLDLCRIERLHFGTCVILPHYKWLVVVPASAVVLHGVNLFKFQRLLFKEDFSSSTFYQATKWTCSMLKEKLELQSL